MSGFLRKREKNLPSGYGKQYLSIGLTTEGYVGHIYYGDRLEGEVENYLLRIDEHPFTPSVVKERNHPSWTVSRPNTPPAVSAISGRAASMSAMPTDAGAARSSMKATRSTKEEKTRGAARLLWNRGRSGDAGSDLKRPDPGPQGDPELFHF